MAQKRTRKDFETDSQQRESSFVIYGTPLPPLDDQARDDGSYVPVWKQEVTDDRGRKRLHGAFTGGFSAGYFNTVGSKEGWSPSTFVSSRTNRAKDARVSVQQRPQDFMDEEDIREQEESQHLSTAEGFGGFGTADDAHHRNALTDLFRPVETMVGEKLMNKMGWKQGQGIGPKVRRPIDPEDKSSELHLFAPADVRVLSFVRKTDHKGLGFAGESDSSIAARRFAEAKPSSRSLAVSDNEDEDRPSLNSTPRMKNILQSKRGAFGVGVLNDTGSDDEDPYSMGPKISYNKSIGREKKLKKKPATSVGSANPLLKNNPIFVSRKLASVSSALRKCHDGRLPLDGFVLAEELDSFSLLSLRDDRYKPPPVPDDWKPSQVSVPDTNTDALAYQSPADMAKSSTLTSSGRGTLLGESVLPGKSVFDYLTPVAREKLMKASGRIDLPPALGEALPGSSLSPPSESLGSQIPHVDSQTALQALFRITNGGFAPYARDSDKGVRYKIFLESQANANNSQTVTPPIRPSGMSASDYIAELHEFTRVAEVFKPVSGLMASRFTTSTMSAPTLMPTHPTTISSDAPVQDLLSKPKPKDPAEEAAQLGMFGHLTRSVTIFHPTRLLCKRFGVEMPSHVATPAEPDPSQSMPSMNASAPSYKNAAAGTGAGVTTSIPAGDRPSRVRSVRYRYGGKDKGEEPAGSTAADVGAERLLTEGFGDKALAGEATVQHDADVQVDPDKNEALERERPGAAVFRAIFGSDDENEDGD